MNRGDYGEEIFDDDSDRESFLRALEEGCEKKGWRVHRFCLQTLRETGMRDRFREAFGVRGIPALWLRPLAGQPELILARALSDG